MARPALAGSLLCLLLAQSPAAAQEQDAPPVARQGAADSTDEVVRQLKAGIHVFRKHGAAIVSVTVTTHALPLPRIQIRGVTQPAMGALAEEHDGTGFVVDGKGHVATTARLVARAASIRIRFADGSTRPARLVGRLPAMGLALLVTEAPDRVRPIETAAAISGDEPQVAWVLSALGEPGEPELHPVSVRAAEDFGSWYDRFVQAEHRLAPGAGGSPLLDADGRLLGMAIGSSTKVDAENSESRVTTYFVQGTDVLEAARRARETGRLDRPMLGILLVPRTATIDLVIPDGPAEQAGLRAGDVFLAIGGYPIEDANCIARSLLRRTVGETVKVRVRRGSEEVVRDLALAVVEPPPPGTEPPLPGATLELSALPTGDGKYELAVFLRDVEAGNLLDQAGVRNGDRLVQVDGREVDNFIQRHHFRPQPELPARIVVERNGARKTIRLRD